MAHLHRVATILISLTTSSLASGQTVTRFTAWTSENGPPHNFAPSSFTFPGFDTMNGTRTLYGVNATLRTTVSTFGHFNGTPNTNYSVSTVASLEVADVISASQTNDRIAVLPPLFPTSYYFDSGTVEPAFSSTISWPANDLLRFQDAAQVTLPTLGPSVGVIISGGPVTDHHSSVMVNSSLRIEYLDTPQVPPQYIVLEFGQPVPRRVSMTVSPDGSVNYPVGDGSMPAASFSAAMQQQLIAGVQKIFDDSGIDNVVVTTQSQSAATRVFFTDLLPPAPGGTTLLGMAYTGIDQFNQRRNDEVVAFKHPDFEVLAETIAHEAGHSLGLIHVDPPGAIEVMDYDAKSGEKETFTNGRYPRKEPPREAGNESFFVTHNPYYHLKRWVDGVSPQSASPGTWDVSGIVETLKAFFNFSETARVLYDVRIFAGDLDATRAIAAYDQVSLGELGSQTISLMPGEGVTLVGASARGGALDVVLTSGDPLAPMSNIVFPGSTNSQVFLKKRVGTSSIFETIALGTLGEQLLAGDYDRDGDVDGGDFLQWQQQLGTEVPRFAGADGNGNGAVDSHDLSVWRPNFGVVFPNGVRVPEPAGASLVITAAVCSSLTSLLGTLRMGALQRPWLA